MRMRNVSRAICLAVAWGLLAAPAGAQSVSGEQHKWVVLLDASASFPAGPIDVRNEALVLIQTLLAIATERDPSRARQDVVTAYRFGRDVQPINLPSGVLTWDRIDQAVRWSTGMPARFKDRTRLDEALERARIDLEGSYGDVRKHVIIISDGELDVDDQNRTSGGRPEREELPAYRRMLDPREGSLAWFVDNGAMIDGLHVRQGFHGQNDTALQEEIRQDLSGFEGSTPGQKALSLVRRMVAGEGTLPSTEGPYILRGLADTTGGRSHTVNADNLLDALRSTIMPDASRGNVVPAGTRVLYVFGRSGVPFHVFARDSEGRPVTLTLGPGNDRRVDPATARFQLAKKEGQASVTWRVEGDLGGGGKVERADGILPMTEIVADWVRPKDWPPLPVYAGSDVPVEIAIRLASTTPRWDVGRWRDYFRDQRPLATVSTEVPGTSMDPLQGRLDAQIAQGSGDRLVTFSGTLPQLAQPGRYTLRAQIVVGSRNSAWDRTLDRVALVDVLPALDLRVAVVRGGSPQLPIPLPLVVERDRASPVALPLDWSNEIVIERWQQMGEAEIVELPFKLRFPERDIDLSGQDNALQTPEERPGGKRVVWRSGSISLGDFTGDLGLEAEGGAGTLYGALKVPGQPVVPDIDVQSALKNLDSDAQLYPLEPSPKRVNLTREAPASAANVIIPDGEGPVWLTFRWRNAERFPDNQIRLSLKEGARLYRNVTATEGRREADPTGTVVWVSPAIHVLRSSLRDHRNMIVGVKVGPHTYRGSLQGVVAPSPNAHARVCEVNGDCWDLNSAVETNITPSDADSADLVFSLDFDGIPMSIPSWRISDLGKEGKFRIAKHEPSHWILNTESVEIPNTTSFSFSVVNGEAYRISLELSWLQKFTTWIDQHTWFHALVDLIRDALWILASIYALIYLLYQRQHKIELSQFFNVLKVGKLVGEDLSKRWTKVLSLIHPAPQYEVRFRRADSSEPKFLRIPADWGRRIFIISAEDGARVEIFLFWRRPRGNCLRITISQTELELIRKDNGLNQWWVAQGNSTDGDLIAQPISSGRLRFRIATLYRRGWVNVSSGRQQHPDDKFIYRIDISRILRKPAPVASTPAGASSPTIPP